MKLTTCLWLSLPVIAAVTSTALAGPDDDRRAACGATFSGKDRTACIDGSSKARAEEASGIILICAGQFPDDAASAVACIKLASPLGMEQLWGCASRNSASKLLGCLGGGKNPKASDPADIIRTARHDEDEDLAVLGKNTKKLCDQAFTRANRATCAKLTRSVEGAGALGVCVAAFQKSEKQRATCLRRAAAKDQMELYGCIKTDELQRAAARGGLSRKQGAAFLACLE
jgi:hypothetical protein